MPTKTTIPVTLSTPVETESFDIEQTSKACGLSAGVLRMWELRYGWPRPGRLPNGYRYFTRYQIEDLKRMATLVKSGMLISRLIQDGMPKWPNDGTQPKTAGPVLLETARNLPQPKNELAQTIRTALLDAMKTQNHGKSWEMLMRCTWEVHPNEQVLCAWLPCLVALDEFRQKEKPFPRAETLSQYIRDHIKEMLGRFPPESRPLWVVPVASDDHGLAYVASAMLSQRGQVARPWLWEQLPRGGAKFLSVGQKPAANKFPIDQHLGHLPLMEAKEGPGITTLAHDNGRIEWLATGAAS
jgi:DNA-binding transcriptional MerR regulator